jgi:hypothetical protein
MPAAASTDIDGPTTRVKSAPSFTAHGRPNFSSQRRQGEVASRYESDLHAVATP